MAEIKFALTKQAGEKKEFSIIFSVTAVLAIMFGITICVLTFTQRAISEQTFVAIAGGVLGVYAGKRRFHGVNKPDK